MCGKNPKYSLDVYTPEELLEVLNYVSQCFFETKSETIYVYQDVRAGKFWGHAGIVLAEAIHKLEKYLD